MSSGSSEVNAGARKCGLAEIPATTVAAHVLVKLGLDSAEGRLALVARAMEAYAEGRLDAQADRLGEVTQRVTAKSVINGYVEGMEAERKDLLAGIAKTFCPGCAELSSACQDCYNLHQLILSLAEQSVKRTKELKVALTEIAERVGTPA